MVEIIKAGEGHVIAVDGKPYARILAVEGATDTFEKIEDGAFRWHRHTDNATDHMRMEMVLIGEPTFTMVPSVSYNGNGWGDYAEYVGDRAEDGTPWSWASHRVTIPACTYSENAEISIALMAEPNSNSACSLYKVDEGEKHVLIFPEEEQPKTLQRHFWGDPFQGTMEPSCDFEGIILAIPSNGGKYRYSGLLDFAWRYYGHEIMPPRSAEEIYRLAIAYTRFLFARERDGFCGFCTGSQWHPDTNAYKKKEHRYELGWVGQNASMANAFIYDYIKNGDKDNLDWALEAHDAWLKYGEARGKFLNARNEYHYWRTLPFETMTAADVDRWEWGEDQYESVLNKIGKPQKRNAEGKVIINHDACNLGTGADCYFEAYDMLKEVGIDKPEYLKAAFDTVDFALESQDENGCFAKAWDDDGNVLAKKGTIGCFLILPIIKAYKRTNDKKYFDAAVKAFDFYYAELEREGFTTAGALDTYSIDKESSSPLLRIALALYDVTGDRKYVEKSEKIAWYLCTWMMHFTVDYPEDCLISKLGYDTFGSTSVSTPHQALDQYALRDVLSFLKLYELTGYKQWRERAIAFWCNACQGISDGTLFINKRLRPAGAQDEAIFHTRWGRHGVKPFGPSQWLPAWPCAFRLENLRWHEDWSVFNEGLTHIEGQIKK
ncbi:MAG: hypothetical protein IIX18_02935 [Clostridia bacterium]|nr:hypothetical protein [Clostridia bacterium]